MKKAFSLVELLVVIAIIAILAAVLMGTFSGGTESARTAQCLSNLRNLASACQSAGVATGHYPPAGSVETVEVVINGSRADKRYDEVHGWISWYSQGSYKGNVGSHVQNENVSMYSSKEMQLYALTNGVLWKYVGGNKATYLCPMHVEKMKKLNPAWTYVMNASFKWDTTKGSGAFPVRDWGGTTYGRLNKADRKLLFAEVQFIENAKLKAVDDVSEETGERTDAILQYSGSTGGGTEIIGFNHKSGKQYCANVAFADGHVEKLMYPKDADKKQLMDLTAWLCTAKDVSFDGKTYELFQD